MQVKPNMIINNYFHGEFSQAEAAESWKRDRHTLEGGGTYRPLIIWMQKSFDPDRIWHISPLVLVKSDPCCFPHVCFGNGVKAKYREQQQKLTPHRPSASFLCMALWHTDSFTWWETRHEATGFYHNRITTSPSLSLSLFHARRHKQPELHWLIFFCLFLIFLYLCYWILWWGSYKR